MKIRNILTVLLLVAYIQVSAQNTANMERMPNGLQYKIYNSNPGPKIKLKDIITFNFVQSTDKDSILVNSFEVNRPATIQVQPAQNIADLMDFFPLLGLNDSALVVIPADSIFVDPQMQRPTFFPKGSALKILVKILKVQSEEEAMAEQKKMMDGMKDMEASQLSKYLSENTAPTIKTASGLRYRITKAATKPKALKGDTVFVNYVGKTLDGKVFDSSIEAVAKAANLQQEGRAYEPISVVVGQGQVIPGWDEGLLLINEGAKASFIIPSELAYGAQGAGQDIRPFTPLLFDVELVKVNRVKKATPAVKPAAKSSVKPTVKKAVKPAVKATAKPVAKPAVKKPAAKPATVKK